MIPVILWGLGFLAGAGAGLFLPGGAEPGFLAAAVCGGALLILGLAHRDLKPIRLGAAALVFLSLGGLRALDARKQFARAIARFPAPVTGTFGGYVAEDPEVLFERVPGGHETGREGDRYVEYVERIRAVVVIQTLEGRPVPSFRARASFVQPKDGGGEVLSYGDSFEARGTLTRPPPALNPGQFDYAGYLRNRGVSHLLFVTPRAIRRGGVSPAASRFGRFSYSFKRRIEEVITRTLPYPENALMSGLLLGERASLSHEMLDAFNLTGTTHILAVSGMNTALIAALLFLGFRVLRAPRKAAALLSMGALGAYVVMTGAPPSVCRAGLFSGLALGAVVMERRPHAGVLLVLTAAILTAFSPFGLTDLSFQLSFLAVMGLAVISPPLLKRLSFLPSAIAVDLAATLGAQLAVWGLLIVEFNQFTTWALPANVLIAPLVGLATAGGFAALLAYALHPALGTLLAAGVEVPLRLITGITAHLARWPAAEFVIGTPSPGWVAAYHALLLFFFLAFWRRHVPAEPSDAWRATQRRFAIARRALGVVALLFAMAALGAAFLDALRPKPFRIAFLAVGHGSSTVLRSPRGEVLVVDGGKGTDGPARWNTLVRYLRHEGLGRVDVIVNTHPDEDHLGGLLDLVRVAPVGRAFQPEGSGSGTRTASEFHALLGAKGIPLVTLKRGDRPELLSGILTRVLHPPRGFRSKRGKENNRSLALRIEIPGEAPLMEVTLPGDLEREGWDELARTSPPKGGWLLAPHHGRASGEPVRAVSILAPQVLVVSDSKDHPELTGAWGPEVRVLSLNRTGCVEVRLDREGRLTETVFGSGTR